MVVRNLLAALLLLSGCPGISGVACQEVTGCPGVCCNSTSHCRQQVCGGVTYTCVPAGDGSGDYIWDQESSSCSNTDGPTSPLDGPSPRDGSNKQDRGCVCEPGVKESCLNGCGQRTCSASCTWGDCSNAGQPVKSAGKGCWDPSHCPPGTPNGPGRCVQCLLCAADGTTYEDTWCAGSKCQPCSPIAPGCH